MRRYYINGKEIYPRQPFNSAGLSHPGNWLSVYKSDDFDKFGITFVDEPRPDPAPPTPHSVSTYRIVRRLEDAGLLEAASAAIEQNLSAKARFNTAGYVRSDDATAAKILRSIGADPAIIMARE